MRRILERKKRTWRSFMIFAKLRQKQTKINENLCEKLNINVHLFFYCSALTPTFIVVAKKHRIKITCQSKHSMIPILPKSHTKCIS